MPGFFDEIKDAAENATGEVVDVVSNSVDAVEDTAADVVGAVDQTLPSAPTIAAPTSFSVDGSIDETTPVVIVGPPDLLHEAPQFDVQGPAGSARLGPVEIEVDIDHVTPGGRTEQGGVVVAGTRVTVGVDGPGVDATFSGEDVFTVNPGVIVLVPKVGGPAVGGSADVTLNPAEFTALPTADLPGLPVPEPVRPSFGTDGFPPPATPPGIPIPYPNMVDAEPSPAPDPEPLQISTDHLGAGSMVPVIGAPDTLEEDPTSLELPDVEMTVGDVDVFADIDPLLPGTRMAHGGNGLGGADVSGDLSAPGLEVDADFEVMVTVDPSLTALVPSVGGIAVGGDLTIDLQPDDLQTGDPAQPDDVPFEEPESSPERSEFEDDLQAIDDTAEEFDIFE